MDSLKSTFSGYVIRRASRSVKRDSSCYSELSDAVDYQRVKDLRLYIVNSCCDERPASYPSEHIGVDDGGEVMLTGFAITG